MEDIFNTLGKIIQPCSTPRSNRLNKKLIFKRAWNIYKIKLKHKCESTFGKELSNCYKIAKLIGYGNYK